MCVSVCLCVPDFVPDSVPGFVPFFLEFPLKAEDRRLDLYHSSRKAWSTMTKTTGNYFLTTELFRKGIRVQVK